MKVITLSGYKGSGKDLMAKYLVDNYGYSRLAFADPLKDIIVQQYDIPREVLDNPSLKDEPLPYLPVIPKDTFSLDLAISLVAEFKTANGSTAITHNVDSSGTFLGVIRGKSLFSQNEHLEQLYHTPRSLMILEGSIKRFVRSDYWVQTVIDEIQNPRNFYDKVVISDLRYISEVDQLKQTFGKDLTTIHINRFDSTNSKDSSENDLTSYKFNVSVNNRGTLEEFYNNIKEVVDANSL